MQDRTHSFGYWLRRRRKALDLTQNALAERVNCSGFSIRKIEADERRPSRRLAQRLAASLAIPVEEQDDFLAAARAVRAASRLQIDAVPVGGDALVEVRDVPVLSQPTVMASVTTPFVGRSIEYGILVGLIASLMDGAGAGHAVLIEGEPGIGKSRLMTEAARYASAHGVQTLWSNCYEIERAMPYQPVIEVVTHAFERVTADALRALAPVSLAELATLVPEIRERVAGLPPLSNDFPEARQARLPRAVVQLLEAARDGLPLVLFVDDIQWADEASARVLHYVARYAATRPVLVIYAYRDEEIDSDERFARLVESLCHDTGARRVPLARLRPADTEELVASLADFEQDTRGLAVRLHRETEGNPFFLTSILQSLSDGETQLEPSVGGVPGLLPDALRVAVRVRLSHVPKNVRPTLDTAAVLGRRFDFDTLLEVTREPEEKLIDALEILIKRRLLREEPEAGVYDFSHDKVREVVYRDIGGVRRRLLHQMVAETLEGRGESETLDREAELAEHYERAHVWSKALRYLVRAGEHSQALFAMRDALHWLDRAVALAESHSDALDESERLAIYEQRGAARAQAGQTQGAVADIRLVVDAVRGRGERKRTRDALVQLGMAHRRADAYEAATACLTEALAESRAMNDEHRAADTLYHLGTVAWSTGRNDQAIGFHQQAVEICERAGFTDLVAVQAHHGRGEAYYANADPAAAVESFTRSLELARGIGDKSYESENLMMIGHAYTGTKGLGVYACATENFEEALAIARSADLQWHLGPTLLGLDHVRACTGRYGDAWTGMQKTLRWLESLKQVRYQLIAHDFIGHLLLDLDLEELALEALERGQALAHDSGIMFWRAAIDTHLAVARSRLGRTDAASTVRAALEQTRRTSERYMMVRCIDGLAEIALAAGDADACRAYGDELLDLAASNGLRELEAVARRWRGEALLADKTYAEAGVELSLAASMAEKIGRVRLQVDVQAELSRLSRMQGQVDAAQRHDARARAIARSIERSLAGSGIEARLRMVSAR